jgi:hypothetical protein
VLELVIALLRRLLIMAEVVVVAQDTARHLKHLDQQEPVHLAKDTQAGMAVTITAHQKAHTTVVAVAAVQEHKDIIVADDMDKPVAVKGKLVVLAAQ